ncbi:unnamed protein product [Staurois parvus]|uniref:Uncharacterized protein n=1 Tax=Staurois parvus TaxID=386267 RepID=A0ABN9FMJ8_9NEOB|nr:unnamed protein product [Staurois parvus]
MALGRKELTFGGNQRVNCVRNVFSLGGGGVCASQQHTDPDSSAQRSGSV